MEPVGDEVDLEDWFDAFREQSTNTDALGPLIFGSPRPLGGGKSGAMAALFHPQGGPIVLKWDTLDKVVHESEARRARPDQQESMATLRARGASHIAVRTERSGAALFGIMAYPYVGPTDRQADLVGDFEWFIRDKYVPGTGDNTIPDDLLQRVYRRLLTSLARRPDDQSSLKAPTEALPDLNFGRWRGLLKTAGQVGNDVVTAGTTLSRLESWAESLVDGQDENGEPRFPDSRWIHGDPRFANIMVDLNDPVDVQLIDFGAGSSGRHIFRDLARFEVDLLLRTSEGSGRIEEIDARGKALFQYQPGRISQLRETWRELPTNVRVAAIWQYVRNQEFPVFIKEKVPELHALFIATELLRRLKWHAELGEEADVGGSVPELLLAIQVLMESVPA